MCFKGWIPVSDDSENGVSFEPSSFLLDEIGYKHNELCGNIIFTSIKKYFRGQTVSYRDICEGD